MTSIQDELSPGYLAAAANKECLTGSRQKLLWKITRVIGIS